MYSIPDIIYKPFSYYFLTKASNLP